VTGQQLIDALKKSGTGESNKLDVARTFLKSHPAATAGDVYAAMLLAGVNPTTLEKARGVIAEAGPGPLPAEEVRVIRADKDHETPIRAADSSRDQTTFTRPEPRPPTPEAEAVEAALALPPPPKPPRRRGRK
jgi:hypothetical protein